MYWIWWVWRKWKTSHLNVFVLFWLAKCTPPALTYWRIAPFLFTNTIFCLSNQVASNKNLKWWFFHVPVAYDGWHLLYLIRHKARTSVNVDRFLVLALIYHFAKPTVFFLFCWHAKPISPHMKQCKNEKLAFLAKKNGCKW